MIDPQLAEPSVRLQCELLRVSRSGLYYEPEPTSPEQLALMRRIDQLHLKHPLSSAKKNEGTFDHPDHLLRGDRRNCPSNNVVILFS